MIGVTYSFFPFIRKLLEAASSMSKVLLGEEIDLLQEQFLQVSSNSILAQKGCKCDV